MQKNNITKKIFTWLDLLGFIGVGLIGYGISIVNIPAAFVCVGVFFILIAIKGNVD